MNRRIREHGLHKDDTDDQIQPTEQVTATIRSHVEELFDAFLAKDRTTLKNGRAADWRGFQIPSTSLIRGVDRYMIDLETALENLTVTRYEFLEFEVDVHDDIALVYYVAKDWLDTPNGEETVLVRALDVYQFKSDGWIQIGSNICVLPDAAAPD